MMRLRPLAGDGTRHVPVYREPRSVGRREGYSLGYGGTRTCPAGYWTRDAPDAPERWVYGLFETNHDVMKMVIKAALYTAQTVQSVQNLSLVNRTFRDAVRSHVFDELGGERGLRCKIGDLRQLRWFARVAPKFDALRSVEFTYYGTGLANSDSRQRLLIGTASRVLARIKPAATTTTVEYVPGVGDVHVVAADASKPSAESPGVPSDEIDELEEEVRLRELPRHGTSLRIVRKQRYERTWRLDPGPDFEKVVAMCRTFWKPVGLVVCRQKGTDGATDPDLLFYMGARDQRTSHPSKHTLSLRCTLGALAGNRTPQHGVARRVAVLAAALENGVPCVLDEPSESLIKMLAVQLLRTGQRPAYALSILAPSLRLEAEFFYGARAVGLMRRQVDRAWGKPALVAIARAFGVDTTEFVLG